MNPFKLFPRFVAAAFPPSPTIIALKIALLPPKIKRKHYKKVKEKKVKILIFQSSKNTFNFIFFIYLCYVIIQYIQLKLDKIHLFYSFLLYYIIYFLNGFGSVDQIPW